MSSIHEFKSQLNSGTRPNRFEVVVQFPSYAGGTEEMAKTAFLVQAASYPSFNQGTIPVPFRGRQLKIAGDRTYEDWTCTIINDQGLVLRNAFEKWHNANNTINSNHMPLDIGETMSTVDIYQLNTQDERIKHYTLVLAWPTTISSVDLAQDSNDTLSTFQVTFAYSDLECENNT